MLQYNVKKKHIEIASVYYDSQTFIYSILEFWKHCSSLGAVGGRVETRVMNILRVVNRVVKGSVHGI